MNDLQIDYFMAVATNLSFTKTSEELFVSQPAISKQISMMEKELGTKLFIRNNKNTRLTPAGELFQEFFRNYKKDLRDTINKAALLQNMDPEVIHIGFVEGWDVSRILPEITEKFKERYPKTRLAIDCCGVKEISTALLTNHIQVALTMENSILAFTELYKKNVASLRKILLYSSLSEQAKKNSLTLADFKQEKFFAPWEIVDKMISHILDMYCQPYGFSPEIEFVHNNESMITCVRNNMGVAIADEWTWCIDSPSLKYLPINVTDTICVTRMREGVNEQTLYLSELLEEAVQNHPHREIL